MKYIVFAILAAALYALSAPFSKMLLTKLSPTMIAGLLYLGAGMGMLIVGLVRKNKSSIIEKKLTQKELPFTLGMIILDVLAPILLMLGLKTSAAENVSLLNNFEIVATVLIALFIFKEKISLKLWIGIILITTASIILCIDGTDSFKITLGSLYVLLACICWGLENNMTKKLSVKDPLQIVTIKGIFSGLGSLIIALILHEFLLNEYVIYTLILGFFSYGLSILFYVYAQRHLGASKTSAFYAVAPFIGVILSLIIFQKLPNYLFYIALIIMIVATYLIILDKETNQQK